MLTLPSICPIDTSRNLPDSQQKEQLGGSGKPPWYLHRITDWFGLEVTWQDHLVRPSCHEKRHLQPDQVAQSPVQAGLGRTAWWSVSCLHLTHALLLAEAHRAPAQPVTCIPRPSAPVLGHKASPENRPLIRVFFF